MNLRPAMMGWITQVEWLRFTITAGTWTSELLNEGTAFLAHQEAHSLS